jgi:hypothetical protein
MMANQLRDIPAELPTPSIQVNDKLVLDESLDRHSHEAVHPEPGPVNGQGSLRPKPGASSLPQTFDSFLRRCAVQHAVPRNKFWGYALLKRVITSDQVRQELLQCGFNAEEAERLCQKIAPPASPGENDHRRDSQEAYLAIFTILVLVRRIEDVKKFLIKELSDGQIIFADLGLISKRIGGWEDSQRDTYELHQQGVMVPYFDTGIGENVEVSPHLKLRHDILLPWLREGNTAAGANATSQAKTGGYGSVTKHKIDPNSHGFERLLKPVGLQCEYVAVKCLKPSLHPDKKAFRNEVDMLKRYGAKARQSATMADERAHRHIITLLATYEQGDEYCFVFPAADCDLDEYMINKPGIFEPGPAGATADRQTAAWLAEQILGLTAAVNLMHGESTQHLDPSPKFTRHGDLKSENIFWFSSKDGGRGIFVVGDLGLADIHGENSRSNVPNANLSTTMTYRSPECDVAGAHISRAFDIWTLGCVFLEVIAWALGGHSMRKGFSDSRCTTGIFAKTRTYFDIIQGEGDFVFKVKDQVIEVCCLHLGFQDVSQLIVLSDYRVSKSCTRCLAAHLTFMTFWMS